MTTQTILGRQGAMGILSIVLALLGLMMFWLEPFGVILGGAGILTGLIGLGLTYSAGGRPYRQAATGVILSLLTLLISLSILLLLRGDIQTQILEPTPQRLPVTTK